VSELVRLVEQVDGGGLAAYVTGRRWFGSKSREVAGARVLEATAARAGSPGLVLALVEIRFAPGTHEIYQVPFGLRPRDEAVETMRRPDRRGSNCGRRCPQRRLLRSW